MKEIEQLLNEIFYRSICLDLRIAEIDGYRYVIENDKIILKEIDIEILMSDGSISVPDWFDYVDMYDYKSVLNNLHKSIDLEFGNRLKGILTNCFRKVKYINSIIANGLEFIEDNAFLGSGITYFEGKRVKRIGDSSFYESQLRKCICPNVECIDSYAFSCSNIEYMDATHITSIDERAFSNCENIKELIFSSLTKLSNLPIFEDCKLEKLSLENVEVFDYYKYFFINIKTLIIKLTFDTQNFLTIFEDADIKELVIYYDDENLLQCFKNNNEIRLSKIKKVYYIKKEKIKVYE